MRTRINSSVCRLPFIKKFALCFVNQLHGRGGSGLAVRNVDDLEVADIEPMLACRGVDFVNRTHQNRLDDSGFGRFRGPAQRRLIARINNEASLQRRRAPAQSGDHTCRQARWTAKPAMRLAGVQGAGARRLSRAQQGGCARVRVSALAGYSGGKNPMGHTLDLPPAPPIPFESGMEASANSSEKRRLSCSRVRANSAHGATLDDDDRAGFR